MIWIGNAPALHNQLISVMHESTLGGHSGAPVTYRRLKQQLAWKCIMQDVQKFVAGCQVCFQAKFDRSSYPGKLQPLFVPIETWETISMDFIEGMPKSATASCILVVVDKFTKFAHFTPLAHPYTDNSVASLFFQVVYKLHGLPASIISDRDPVLTSSFLQSLFKLSGVTLKMSYSYHP
jgi:hypothetical protein